MKSQKFLLSNLFIGAILGVVLSGPFFIVWNLLANNYSFSSIDIMTVFLIIIPISMIGMVFVLRNRLPQIDSGKINTNETKKK
jgi:hypothetical protein